MKIIVTYPKSDFSTYFFYIANYKLGIHKAGVTSFY